MGGWKTWAGAIGLIASGVGLIAGELTGESFDFTQIMKGVALIGAGLTAIGVGHKVEKAADATAGK